MNDKLTFWKKLKISIVDFDGYQDLAAEKVYKTILYLVILMVIFSLVITGLYIYRLVNIAENVKQYIAENIETITFQDNKLEITPYHQDEEINMIDENETGFQVIINTNIKDEEEKNAKIEEIKLARNGILVLEDKILVKNELLTDLQEYPFKAFTEQMEVQDDLINKDTILEYMSTEKIFPVIMAGGGIIFIYIFIVYLTSILADILLFSAMGYIFTIITRIRLRYSAVYNITAYAVTLPIILNLIYIVINCLTGFTIKYFDVMYVAVTSIYIMTAILMIKSDVIKKQIELAKIIQEQEKVHEELKRKEEEEKEKQEREKQKKEEEEKRKQEEENPESEKPKSKKKKNGKPDINIGDEPEGNNV